MILTDDSINLIKEKTAKYPKKKSGILPALTVAYNQLGFVDNEIYEEISKVIKVPVVEIAEAATFYTMFPKKSRGKYLIQICHNISCALLGADSLLKYLENKLDIQKDETTEDNLFTLITVECLGSCSTAPMMQINNKYHENLTHERVDNIIKELKAKA